MIRKHNIGRRIRNIMSLNHMKILRIKRYIYKVNIKVKIRVIWRTHIFAKKNSKIDSKLNEHLYERISKRIKKVKRSIRGNEILD